MMMFQSQWMSKTSRNDHKRTRSINLYNGALSELAEKRCNANDSNSHTNSNSSKTSEEDNSRQSIGRMRSLSAKMAKVNEIACK